MKPSLVLRQTLLYLFPLYCAPVFAQQTAPAISCGDEYHLPKKHTDMGLAGNSTDGYVQVGHDYGTALSFLKFDPQMHAAGERIVSLEQLSKGYTTEAFMPLGGRYYWFYNDKDRLFVREYDIKTNTLKNDARELISFGNITGNGRKDEEQRKWTFYTGAGRSGLLIRCRKEPEEKKDSRNRDVMGFLALDSNLNKLWSREIRMPYTEKKMDEVAYGTDRAGNVYVLAKVYDSSSAWTFPEYHHELLKWEKGKNDAVVIPVRPGGHYVGDARIIEDAQGTVGVVGYYTLRKNAGADGVFHYQLDPAGRELVAVHKGLYEFPISELIKYLSPNAQRHLEKRENRGEAEAKELDVVRLDVTDDGTISIYGEKHVVLTELRAAAGNPSSGNYTSEHAYFEEIMALQVKSDGALGWVHKLPKNQSGHHGIGNMSFRQFSYGSDQYLLYIDNSRNLEIRENQDPAGHLDGAGGLLTLGKIDASGKIRRMPVFSDHKDKMLYYVDAVPAGDRQLIVRCREGWRKGTFRSFLVTLP